MKIGIKTFVALIAVCLALGAGAFTIASKAEQTAKNQSDKIASLQSEVSIIADTQSTLQDGIDKLTSSASESETSTPNVKFVVITEIDEISGTVEKDTVVLADPDEEAEELGELKEDTKVTVDAEYGNYYRISTPDKKVVNAWVDKTAFTKSKSKDKDDSKDKTEATATPKPTEKATAKPTAEPTKKPTSKSSK